MAFELHVGDGGSRVPELDAAVFAARDEPIAVGGKRDAQNKVAVSGKCGATA